MEPVGVTVWYVGVLPWYLVGVACVLPEGTRCNGFLCSNHTCLPATAHCNGVQECPDGADEHNCGERLGL